MPKRILVGGDDFAELVRGNYLLADKTLMVKAVVEDPSKAILITRPRRWGKSLNLSMLRYFLAPQVGGIATAGLFEGLNISKDTEFMAAHQGQSPVIYISFKDLKAETFDEMLARFRTLLCEVYTEHLHLLSSDSPLISSERLVFNRHLDKTSSKVEIEDSLKFLTHLLWKVHGKRSYILIDEYDTPLNFVFSNASYFESASLLMRNFLSAGLKSNSFLEKGIMTGILRISKDNMLSGLNNLEIYTILTDTRYAPYFGFADAEVVALFADQVLEKKEAETRAWYNGYCVNGITLYNPWSIMKCLTKGGVLGPYWVNTSDDTMLKHALQNSASKIKTHFESLVAAHSVEVLVSDTLRFDEVERKEDMLWNLLISAGYLKVLSVKNERSHYSCTVAIPNQEVLGFYQDIFLEWARDISEGGVKLKLLLSALLKGDVAQFATDVQSFLEAAASVYDYSKHPEAFYHGFMLALISSMTDSFYIFSNKESGLGRPDIMLIPKDTSQTVAFILEFKHVHKREKPEKIAEQALAQINDQHYAAGIMQHDYITQILHIGIAFNGKKVRCAYEYKDVSPLLTSTSGAGTVSKKRQRAALVFGAPDIAIDACMQAHIDRLIASWSHPEDRDLKKALRASRRLFLQSPTTKAFQVGVAGYGLALHDVSGDGNCFFYALIDQLQIRCRGLAALSSLAGRYDHATLRSLAVQGLLAREDLHDFMSDPDSLVARASTDRAWADDFVISTLARVLGITIVLINSDGNPPTIIDGGREATVYLGYQVGVHFQSLRGEPVAGLTAMITAQHAIAAPSARIHVVLQQEVVVVGLGAA